jgi:hypothetical protein
VRPDQLLTHIQIFAIPDERSVFINRSLCYLPAMLSDTAEKLEPGPPEEDSEIQQVLLCDFGQALARPYLLVLLRSNLLAVYEAVLDFSSTAPSRLACRFSKVLVHELSARSQTQIKLAAVASGPNGCRGVFVSGDKPVWLLAADHGKVQVFDFQEAAVPSLAVCASQSYFTSGVVSLFFLTLRVFSFGQDAFVATLADACWDQALPWTTVNADRTYMGIAYDKPSESYVAASMHTPPFELFSDEDGQPVWRPDRKPP